MELYKLLGTINHNLVNLNTGINSLDTTNDNKNNAETSARIGGDGTTNILGQFHETFLTNEIMRSKPQLC